MPWIYKYTDTTDNITKYVGLVYGNTTQQLFKRLHEHERDFDLIDKWKPYKNHNFNIQVLKPDQVKTKADAEILEAHFIHKFGTDKYLNTAKSDWGACSLIDDSSFKWEAITYMPKHTAAYNEEIDNLTIKYDSKIAELQSELDDAETKLRQVSSDYDILQKDSKFISTCNEILKEEIKKLTIENIDLKIIKEINFSSLTPEQRDIIILNSTIHKLTDDYTSLKESYDNLSEYNRKDRDTIVDQRNEIQTLKEQLAKYEKNKNK